MYESQTQEVILKRMLDNVPSDIDKIEGSVIYDASAPTSIEVMLLYAMCDYFLKNTFGDTADREYLIERAKERGLSPKKATYAVVKGAFTPETLNIPIGSRFSYDAVNYEVTEKLENGSVPLEESMKLFEEGTKLVNFCNSKLNAAEQKFTQLITENSESDNNE